MSGGAVTVPAVEPPALLAREGRALVERLRLWTPARWAAAAQSVAFTQGGPAYGGAPATRGDLVAHLIQALADAAADVEGHPRRGVPRLDTDLALPDQLAVMIDDLVRAGPDDELAIRSTAHLLLHRTQLLGDEVPGTLAAALGGDPIALGVQVCVS